MITIILINNSTPYTYGFTGGLAQLGERLNGIQKVKGSNPLSSTIILIINLPKGRGGYVSLCLARCIYYTHTQSDPNKKDLLF